MNLNKHFAVMFKSYPTWREMPKGPRAFLIITTAVAVPVWLFLVTYGIDPLIDLQAIWGFLQAIFG